MLYRDVLGVGICRKHPGALRYGWAGALDQPFEHFAVRHDERHLAAHLRDHRAERETLVEGGIFNRLAGEFNGEEVQSAGAEVADDAGEQVSHADALRELAGGFDLHRLGHAEPVDALNEGGSDVRVADAGSEGAHAAQQVHVAVGAEHHVARFDHAGFEHHVLTDAVVDVEHSLDALAFAEFADDLLIRGHLLGVRGGLQVERESDLVRIPDLSLFAHLLLELQHAVGAAKVAAGRPVDVAPDAVPHFDRMAGRVFHDLDYRCLAHV